MQRQVLNSLQASVDRLDKTGLLVGHTVGDADRSLRDNPIHHADVLGESSTSGFEACCATYFFIGLALGKGFVAAVITFAARNVVEDHHSITGIPIVDAFADGGYHAGDFVSEDARGGVGARGDFFKIGAADAAGVHADKQFTR